jgi:hypothetical protein
VGVASCRGRDPAYVGRISNDSAAGGHYSGHWHTCHSGHCCHSAPRPVPGVGRVCAPGPRARTIGIVPIGFCRVRTEPWFFNIGLRNAIVSVKCGPTTSRPHWVAVDHVAMDERLLLLTGLWYQPGAVKTMTATMMMNALMTMTSPRSQLLDTMPHDTRLFGV